MTLGGRRIEIRRPRARGVQGAEVSLPSFAWAANRDALEAHTLDAIAVGVSTRRYARSLDAPARGSGAVLVFEERGLAAVVALYCERLKVWLSRSSPQSCRSDLHTGWVSDAAWHAQG